MLQYVVEVVCLVVVLAFQRWLQKSKKVFLCFDLHSNDQVLLADDWLLLGVFSFLVPFIVMEWDNKKRLKWLKEDKKGNEKIIIYT